MKGRFSYIGAVVTVVLILFVAFASATDYAFITTGNWSNDNSWSPTGEPGAGDDVTINENQTVTVDVSAREVVEFWLEDQANVDLANDVCACGRLFVYRVSGLSGPTDIDGGTADGTREFCAGEIRLAETVKLTVSNNALLSTPDDCGACTCN